MAEERRPANPEVPPGGVVPERDLKPMMDEADQILAALASGEAMPGGPEGMSPEGAMMEEAVVEEMPAEEGRPEEMMMEEEVVEEEVTPGDTDIQTLAEMLEIEVEAADRLFGASQQMARTRGMTPKELGELLLEDFQLRMELERIAGGAEDEAAMMDMAMMGPPMGGPPME